MQLLSGLIKLFILLFADDVALLATTPCGLQNQLDSLQVCYDRLKMEVTRIREILCKTGFYFVWLQQGVGDVKSFLCVFKRRLSDMFTQEWTADIRDKERHVTYCCFKKLFEAERYLSDIDICIVLE